MKIYLGADLDFYHPQKERWLAVSLEQPAKLADLLVRLGIPLGEIHLVVVNGENATLDAIVTDTDEVKLFSPVGGG